MNGQINKLGRLLLLAPLSCAGSSLSLTHRSPFIPPGFDPSHEIVQKAVPSAPGTYEVAGIYTLGPRLFANIRNPATGETIWLESNQPRDGLTLVSFNEDDNTCILKTADGQKLELLFAEIRQPSLHASPQVAASVAQAQPSAIVLPVASGESIRVTSPDSFGNRSASSVGFTNRISPVNSRSPLIRQAGGTLSGAYREVQAAGGPGSTGDDPQRPVYINPRVRSRLNGG